MLGRLVLALAAAFLHQSSATSMKIDYLKLTDVRTDPITHPGGPSPHVHSFYGASEAAPSTTYEKLRAAAGNTGNVKENKSLYWHPTIYRYDKNTGRFAVQSTSYFSTYYIWPTGDATAFPDGLKMIGGGAGTATESRPESDCSNPGPCPDGDCERWNDFFPATSCDELEMSMLMPSCWDGVNLDSADHRSHMAYPKNSEADGKCPETHPVRLPQIAVFTRIAPYLGGVHLFSDGTGHFHADYFSGWKSKELQEVLDECENDSMFSAPTGWCEDHVTFRDAPKDEDAEDEELREKLVPLQPPAFDASAISDEPVDDVAHLPGGNQPVVDATPRCVEQKSKKACKALRYSDTEFPLGGKFGKRKACKWTKESDDDEDEEDEDESDSDADSESEDEEDEEDEDESDSDADSDSDSDSDSDKSDKKRALRWYLKKKRQKRCKAKDACGELKGKKKCKKFGAASRCVYEGGECFFEGE